MEPSGVHSCSVGTPKRVTVRVEFGHSELVLEFRYSKLILQFRVLELQYEFQVSDLEPQC